MFLFTLNSTNGFSREIFGPSIFESPHSKAAKTSISIALVKVLYCQLCLFGKRKMNCNDNSSAKCQTLENIINKAKIKMRGLNYSIHLETNCDQWPTKAGFLIMGLDIAYLAVSMVSRKDRNICFISC
uniref:Uncharacterized protein n=1 Tax=Onchocerca volvulus TaxID=6282 RepID=A0A8R1TJY8_ONCVO